MGRRNSRPASSAIWASLRLSCQLPDQRSGTVVTARPDEQLGPNSPIFNRLALYMATRSRIEASRVIAPHPIANSDKIQHGSGTGCTNLLNRNNAEGPERCQFPPA